MCPLGACSQRVHPQKRPSFLLRGVLHACGIAGRRGRLLPCLLGALRHDALVPVRKFALDVCQCLRSTRGPSPVHAADMTSEVSCLQEDEEAAAA